MRPGHLLHGPELLEPVECEVDASGGGVAVEGSCRSTPWTGMSTRMLTFGTLSARARASSRA